MPSSTLNDTVCCFSAVLPLARRRKCCYAWLYTEIVVLIISLTARQFTTGWLHFSATHVAALSLIGIGVCFIVGVPAESRICKLLNSSGAHNNDTTFAMCPADSKPLAAWQIHEEKLISSGFNPTDAKLLAHCCKIAQVHIHIHDLKESTW